jgi:CheY-like chemotaxis protein
VAARLLEKLGARVTVASNGAEALMLLAQERMDLILMDCQMPVMDGYQTTQKIRALTEGETETLPSTPIIALTGNVIPEEMAKCFECGMNDVITKPVQLVILQAKVTQWLTKEALPLS